ncbi:nitrile hydratase subunit alpha [Elioraea sp.]|uniref:nitrile hydratase subunit alpha n=1 Tax=Elioraea sp. TaxID=2185103 RepID=UPI003F712D9B
MPHDGPHDHPHDHAPDDPSFASRPALGARALRELLEEAGVLAAGEVARQIERMDTITPALGAEVVARAWVDPAFKARLLADGSAAVRAFGVEMGATPLHVVENTDSVHNMIVCTLCSCYPKPLLGIPPDWYKSFEYRSRAVREPRAVLAEFGVRLPEGVTVRVHDSTADLRYLVLPRRPDGTEGWDEARLAALVSRDCMIGTTVPTA